MLGQRFYKDGEEWSDTDKAVIERHGAGFASGLELVGSGRVM
jgi:hypothetical protein